MTAISSSSGSEDEEKQEEIPFRRRKEVVSKDPRCLKKTLVNFEKFKETNTVVDLKMSRKGASRDDEEQWRFQGRRRERKSSSRGGSRRSRGRGRPRRGRSVHILY